MSGDSERDHDDVERRRDERTLGPDEETLDGSEPVPTLGGEDDVPETEVPTGEIDAERDERTVLEGATPTLHPSAARGEDEETLAGEDDTLEVDTGHPGVSQTIGDDEETMVGGTATEAPTSEIDPRRAAGTVVGDFAGTRVEGAASRRTVSEEDETVFEPGGTESLRADDPNATRADGVGGTRKRGNVRRIDTGASRGVSATARDAAAAGYTEKGGHGAGRATPIRLAEGEDLAGRYTLVKRLGKGGMGEVWRATHNLLKGDRAIKVIKASISKDKTFRERFLAEGQTMMRVKHGGVVEVTDLDQTRSGELYMVMQYLEGRTLYDAIRDKEHPLCEDVRDAVRIFKELADGMQRIHDERIVHKDLKSDNSLLVREDDGLEHPKVIDFGLAKRMDDGDPDVQQGAAGVDGTYDPDLRTTLSGTLAYMAPEQFLGNPSSFQSDIYAFGVMMFECFNKGEYPLPRGGLAHYLSLHAEGKKPELLRAKRPDLPKELTDISDRCMAPRKSDRPESFAQVAYDLQWWLDAPERARKLRQKLMFGAAALLLIAIAITGFLMSETTASLGDFQAKVADRFVPATEGVVYLSERGLAALELSAEITGGEAKEPRLEIDGERADAQIRTDLGRLLATVDASQLADGPHDVVLLASAGAAPARMSIVIDRKAPGIESIEVPGARAGFVSSQSPEVRVALDESTIATVVARVDGRSQYSGQPAAGADGPRNAWVVAGTAGGDGPCSMEIEVRDLAGNVTTQRFSYVRDTVLEKPVVTDLKDDGAGGRLLPVRSGVGAKLLVALGEPGRAELRANGGAPVERTGASAGVQEFDLPPVPGEGYPATLLVEDRAGNAQTITMSVKQLNDEIRITALDGSARPMSVKGDEDVRLSFSRSYAIEPGSAVLAVRVRDADGRDVKESPRDVTATFENATRFGSEIVIAKGELGEGTWRLSPAAQGQAKPQSLELTVDKTPPRIHGVVVRDASGKEIPAGAWSLTRAVAVEVDAEDLALASIKIEDFTGPTPAPAPGRRIYRFERTLPADGLFNLSVTLADTAGNLADRSFAVRVDATDPVLTLTAPVNGAQFNDQNPAVIKGTCSEAPFTLHVAGDLVAGGEAASAQNDTGFEDGFLLSVGDDRLLRVWATDSAGRRSAERVVRVTVKPLEVELPDTWVWKRNGITSSMEKVRAGDIQIGTRMFPVELSFIDRNEVTNAEYRLFLAAVAKSGDAAWRHPEQPAGWDHTPPAETWGDPTWSADDRPVVNVAYWDAYAFAHWSGRRLPTEAEWVKAAARKEGELDLLRWPTGNEWKDGVLATSELVSTLAFQGPVSALSGADKSPNGCLHMGGNVSEWVRLERVDEGEPQAAVRGGNWFLSRVAADVRTVPAKRYDRSLRAATIGFRCAVGADVVRGEAASR